MEAANGVKNMSLAHEIAVNANFEIQKMEAPASRYVSEEKCEIW